MDALTAAGQGPAIARERARELSRAGWSYVASASTPAPAVGPLATRRRAVDPVAARRHEGRTTRRAWPLGRSLSTSPPSHPQVRAEAVGRAAADLRFRPTGKAVPPCGPTTLPTRSLRSEILIQAALEKAHCHEGASRLHPMAHMDPDTVQALDQRRFSGRPSGPQLPNERDVLGREHPVTVIAGGRGSSRWGPARVNYRDHLTA